MNVEIYNPLNLPAEFVTGGATLDDAVRYHAALSDFYSAHKELLEAHPTEFYTRNQLDLLSQYADELRLIPCTQMHRLLTRPAGGPGALSAYFSEAQRLAMAREAKLVGVEAMPIGRDLRAFVADKKVHEVERFVNICRHLNVEHFVDVGAGKQALSVALSALGCQGVTAVDAVFNSLSAGLRKQEWLMRKQTAPAAQVRVLHATVGSKSSGAAMGDIATQADNHDHDSARFQTVITELTQRSVRFALVGLHTCGELSSAILGAYASTSASACCVVGCCYQHIQSYPMSKSVRQGTVVTRQALLAAACSTSAVFIDRQAQRQRTQRPPSQLRLARALLQELAEKISFDGLPAKIPMKSSDSFAQYCMRALESAERCDAAARIYGVSSLDQLFEQRLQDAPLIVGWHFLREALAACVEAMVTVDRAVYLLERGSDVAVLPVFDPALSPRNLLILATKPPRQSVGCPPNPKLQGSR
jgi:hypothetical protein